jgi:hypothetical protein
VYWFLGLISVSSPCGFNAEFDFHNLIFENAYPDFERERKRVKRTSKGSVTDDAYKSLLVKVLNKQIVRMLRNNSHCLF